MVEGMRPAGALVLPGIAVAVVVAAAVGRHRHASDRTFCSQPPWSFARHKTNITTKQPIAQD